MEGGGKSDYVVCIPSYKRSHICNDKTLTTLKNAGIHANRIYVYVANKQEYDEYLSVLDKSLYHRLIIGEKGIVQQRQFIMDQWPEGKQIVYLDDDVEKIDLSLSPRFRGKPLDYFIRNAFSDCKEMGAFTWGVYAVYNPFFRKGRKELSTELNFIVGTVYGIINRPHLRSIRVTAALKENGQKEDVERTIKYFIHDGIVLRYNRIGFVTKYYGTEGGLGRFEERIQSGINISKAFAKLYPDYGHIKMRKNGMAEFVLKKIPARIGPNEVDDESISHKTTQKQKKKQNTRKHSNTLKRFFH